MKIATLLLVSLLAVPAQGADDKKDSKKKDEKKGQTAEDVMAQAEQKAAAGDRKGAAEMLTRAAAMPGAAGAIAMLRLGRLLESGHELDTAIDAYRTAADGLAGPEKGEALGRLAVVQEVRGSGDPAATAEAALAADAEGVWPAIAVTRARVRQKKVAEAETASAKIAASDVPAAVVSVGIVQEAKGDLAGAEASFRKALAAEAGRADATIGLARALRKAGRAGEAEPLLNALLEASPGAIEAYKESARVKVALGRPEEAAGDAATAAALAENDPEAAVFAREIAIAKALSFVKKGQVAFALQDLTALRDQNPDAADVRVGLARVLIAKRDVPGATAELEKAVALAPENAEAHNQLGYLNHALKQSAATALPAYEKAVALDPANVEYRTNLGAVLSELQQLDRAQAELTQVTATPGYAKADAWIYLGGAYLGAKKYKEAVAALEKALAIAPEVQMTNAYMAWAYFALKDAANFKKYGAKARDLGYKDTRFLDNLKRVEAGEAIK
jgi:cellulose synthase operon protein C